MMGRGGARVVPLHRVSPEVNIHDWRRRGARVGPLHRVSPEVNIYDG